jgi:hypothetical protein
MLSQKNFNRLMLVGVYFTFIEPSKGLFMVPLLGFYANLQELGLMFFAVGYFNSGRDISAGAYRTLSWCAICLLGVICSVEIFKLLQYGGGFASIIRVNRINLNGLCALLFLALGLRPGAKQIIHHVFCAILISSGLALLFGLLGIRPTNPFVSLGAAALEKKEWMSQTGRFGGMHSNLSVAMVLLLYFYAQNARAFVIPKKWRRVVLLSACVTVLIGVTSFNRTLMGATVVALITVTLLEFRIRAFIAGLMISICVVGVAWVAILTNENVEKQFRQRIGIVFKGKEALLESIYYGGRENIYAQVAEGIKEYPLLGLPYGVPAFVAYKDFAAVPYFYTDVSFLNAYIRYGILAGLLMMLVVTLLLFVSVQWRNFFLLGELNMYARMLCYAVPVYALISLNYDVYFRHSAIVFFVMIAMHIGYHREIARRQPRLR